MKNMNDDVVLQGRGSKELLLNQEIQQHINAYVFENTPAMEP
jgi:hypothetical protein